MTAFVVAYHHPSISYEQEKEFGSFQFVAPSIERAQQEASARLENAVLDWSHYPDKAMWFGVDVKLVKKNSSNPGAVRGKVTITEMELVD